METIKLCCSYCQREFTDKNKMNYDHMIPKSVIGSKNRNGVACGWFIYTQKQKDNILISCIDCNKFKGNCTLDNFKYLLERIRFDNRTFETFNLYKSDDQKGWNKLILPDYMTIELRDIMLNSVNLLLTKNEFEELPVKYF